MYFLKSFCVLILFLSGAQHLRAQTSVTPVNRNVERIQELERERLRQREEGFRQQQSVAPQPTINIQEEVEVSDQTECRPVDRAIVSGITLFRPQEFLEERRSLEGGCISASQIAAVLRAITNRYVERGYVTSRALVAPAESGSGTLEIFVVEGRLNEIRTESVSARGEGGYSRGEIATAFPPISGKVLNLRDLEQGVDQLSRLSSSDPDIDIIPAQQPGMSDLVVKRRRTGLPIRLGLSVNSDGAASTGRYLSTLTLDADSPLGLGDVWSVYFSRPIEARADQGSEGMGLLFSLPLGYSGLTVSVGRFRYATLLQSVDQAFASTGSSYNASVALDRLLYRDALTKAFVTFGIVALDTENRIQGIRLSTSSYRLVYGNAEFRLQRRVGAGVASLSLGFSRGLDVFGANAAATGPGGPKLTFRKIEAAADFQRPFELMGNAATYAAQFRTAFALDPVFPSERFSLGGSSTIRGFRDDGISGRGGIFLRQQLGISLWQTRLTGLDTSLSCLAGYDAGAIFSRKADPFERGLLHSSVYGLRLTNRNVQGELTVSLPLSAPEFVTRRRVEILASIRMTLQ